MKQAKAEAFAGTLMTTPNSFPHTATVFRSHTPRMKEIDAFPLLDSQKTDKLIRPQTSPSGLNKQSQPAAEAMPSIKLGFHFGTGTASFDPSTVTVSSSAITEHFNT